MDYILGQVVKIVTPHGETEATVVGTAMAQAAGMFGMQFAVVMHDHGQLLFVTGDKLTFTVPFSPVK